ncbi:MAG: hypothetical protein MZW92_48930 [Comamonadaceae bacterium]|nr:hypothetical protein [Comamonadaceae bacterium]
MDYALRFEHSPPAWIDYSAAPAARPAGARSAAACAEWRANGAAAGVDRRRTSSSTLEQPARRWRRRTRRSSSTCRRARSIDLAGADLLLRVLKAFQRSQRELTLVGGRPAGRRCCRSTVESGPARSFRRRCGCCCSNCSACWAGRRSSRTPRSSTASPSRYRRHRGSRRRPT